MTYFSAKISTAESLVRILKSMEGINQNLSAMRERNEKVKEVSEEWKKPYENRDAASSASR
jgi:proteasome assembly chaperone (PAC2) family protein